VLRQLGDERLRKLVGLERDGFQLVGESLESVGEERHEHRLGRVPKLGVQGAEEAKSSRAPVGRLLRLVRDHRLERGQRRVDLHEVSLGELVHDGLEKIKGGQGPTRSRVNRIIRYATIKRELCLSYELSDTVFIEILLTRITSRSRIIEARELDAIIRESLDLEFE
jgi:hypothetical protein